MKALSSAGLCQTLLFPHVVHASLLLWALVCAFAACTQVLKGFRWLLLLIILCVVPLQSWEVLFSTFVWYELLFSMPAPRIPGEEVVDAQERNRKNWCSGQISVQAENLGCLQRREARISFPFMWQLTQHSLVFNPRSLVSLYTDMGWGWGGEGEEQINWERGRKERKENK